MDLNPKPGMALKKWDRQTLEDYVQDKLDPFRPELPNETLALYSANHDPEYTFTTMTSDLRVGCMNDVVAAKAAEALSS
jgi:hypothetical protein